MDKLWAEKPNIPEFQVKLNGYLAVSPPSTSNNPLSLVIVEALTGLCGPIRSVQSPKR